MRSGDNVEIRGRVVVGQWDFCCPGASGCLALVEIPSRQGVPVIHRHLQGGQRASEQTTFCKLAECATGTEARDPRR